MEHIVASSGAQSTLFCCRTFFLTALAISHVKGPHLPRPPLQLRHMRLAAYYIEAKPVGQQPVAGRLDVPPNTPLNLGSGYPDSSTLPGALSNLRMYKRSLGANEVASQTKIIGCGLFLHLAEVCEDALW
jgi:hypothetical protein